MIDQETNEVLKSIRRDIKDLFRQLGKQATRMPVGGGGGGGDDALIYVDTYADLADWIDIDPGRRAFVMDTGRMYMRALHSLPIGWIGLSHMQEAPEE